MFVVIYGANINLSHSCRAYEIKCQGPATEVEHTLLSERGESFKIHTQFVGVLSAGWSSYTPQSLV